MLVRILALVAAVAPFASAQSQITFSQPAAGASISAAEPLTVKFTSTGSGFTTYNLYLFAGGNAASAMVCFALFSGKISEMINLAVEI